MAISDATSGFGTELFIDIGAGLVKVAEIDDIPELPSFETRLYNVSSQDTVGVDEFKKHPLKEGVEISIVGNYVIGSTAETTLQAAEDSLDPIEYRIIVPQGDTDYYFEGSALFYNFKRMNPKEEKRTFTIAMKPTAASAIDAAPEV